MYSCGALFRDFTSDVQDVTPALPVTIHRYGFCECPLSTRWIECYLDFPTFSWGDRFLGPFGCRASTRSDDTVNH